MDIKITVIDRTGKSHQLQAPTDMAMCASCQCYILSDHPLSKKSPDEEAMLSEAFHVQENSRLCCQISIEKKLEGLKVELAPE